MSSGINLLPWREERRRRRDRHMLMSGIAIWILCVAVVFAVVAYFDSKQDYQKKRNEYLNVEISLLDRKIKEINALREKKDSLIARMEVIQNLQRERTQIVHLFDDIVRKIPEGIYFSRLQKKNKQFSMDGTAQSNARVSELMNRLDSSDWFANPDLNVINVKPSENVRLSQFKLKVSESRDDKDEEF